ncbi:MAG: hypothetical protein QM703_11495 [Gemmatales bacterium]
MTNRHILLLLVPWLAASLALGASGVLTGLKPPVPQIILFSITVALIVAIGTIPPLRRWAFTVDVRWLVGFHLTRFVGFYFLYLYMQNVLPFEFAVIGGIGDIVVAASAVVLLQTVSPHSPWGKWLYLGWNLVGLIDIFMVVITAGATALINPRSMEALQRLPLCLLILFVVPIIIATHFVMIVRLLRRPSGG